MLKVEVLIKVNGHSDVKVDNNKNLESRRSSHNLLVAELCFVTTVPLFDVCVLVSFGNESFYTFVNMVFCGKSWILMWGQYKTYTWVNCYQILRARGGLVKRPLTKHQMIGLQVVEPGFSARALSLTSLSFPKNIKKQAGMF